MEIYDKAKIQWACRRGMRELDILIMPFFQHEYDTLEQEQKQQFILLLEQEDPDLFSWLMDHATPQDPQLAKIVKLIQKRNNERGPMAL